MILYTLDKMCVPYQDREEGKVSWYLAIMSSPCEAPIHPSKPSSPPKPKPTKLAREQPTLSASASASGSFPDRCLARACHVYLSVYCSLLARNCRLLALHVAVCISRSHTSRSPRHSQPLHFDNHHLA